VTTYTNYSSSDYNGFRPNPNTADSFEWNTPAFGVMAAFGQNPVQRRYGTLQDYREATGQEQHSVLVDYDVFANVSKPDPADPQRVYTPAGFDFSPRAGSSAIDAGIELPTITDGFTGRAPDLGAFEFGRPPFHYGPR
jgi:hypothetical protein